jgi:hypothetical protein
MSGIINVIIPCLCNEVCGMSGVFYVIARVYVMKFEVCQQCFVLLSLVYVMKFEVCQQCFVLSRVCVMKFEVCQE